MVLNKNGVEKIHDVLFIPDLDQNLLCVGPLMKHKYSLHFEGDRCIIYDKRDRRQILTQVRMVNKSFTFFLRYINDVVRRENVMDDS